jgi:hypothetical protein
MCAPNSILAIVTLLLSYFAEEDEFIGPSDQSSIFFGRSAQVAGIAYLATDEDFRTAGHMKCV